ncbi:MAG: hypothetical protein IKE95_08265 [Methanobrevibacter sp.]|nr:hypothetical protein [Methanobrevibacter sp.]
MNGIDISNWQGGKTPSNYNIDFCICKATEGTNFVDDFCDGFIQDCIRNNILFGYYHFARNGNAKSEAKFFWNNTLGYSGYGIPVLDYEVWGQNNDVKWCEEFITEYHELSGIWPILYISASYCGAFENSWISDKCGLWVAGYTMEYTNWIDREMPYNIYPWKFAAIWQFTSRLWDKFDGDIAYMDKKAWMKYANPNASEAKPQNPEKTIDDLAREVILGEYGTGKERKKLLGKNYDAVQKRINELFKVANDVIKGKYGNNETRKKKLKAKGYPYDTVQMIVNILMN